MFFLQVFWYIWMKDCEGFFTVLHNQQVNATHTPKVKG